MHGERDRHFHADALPCANTISTQQLRRVLRLLMLAVSNDAIARRHGLLHATQHARLPLSVRFSVLFTSHIQLR